MINLEEQVALLKIHINELSNDNENYLDRLDEQREEIEKLKAELESAEGYRKATNNETKIMKIIPLKIAIKELEKDLKKAEKNVARNSQKLGNADMSETTLKGRARLRMNLDAACKARDIVSRQLEFTENWLNEIRNGKERGE